MGEGFGEDDNSLVRQIVTALRSKPLSPIQVAVLKTWYDAPDWIHIRTLRQTLINERFAAEAKKAEMQVRSALTGLGMRMSGKVPIEGDRDQTKLATLVDIRRERGSASHRLTSAGRKGVTIVLKL